MRLSGPVGQARLLVDIDPQANATSGIGIDHRNLPHGIYEALTARSGFMRF